MSHPDHLTAGPPDRPRRATLLAVGIFIAAALTLCWPMLGGKFLAGPWSDQYLAGYSFRAFAAHFFREFGSIPQWNPYLFGGLPFVGAAHGDIFYPTAALRWFLPTDLAMNLGFAGHIVLAGVTMYALLRTLKLGWAAAVTGGLGYELTGIVVSLVHPGHDGKLYVSALAPLLFLGVVLAVRDRRFAGYGVIALSTGLALQGHPQAAQYLITAAGIWGLFWLFGREGPSGWARLRVVTWAGVAAALGIGLYAIYALPMVEYVPFSPRAVGGYNTGWEHAISFSLPPEELLGTLLPRIDGGVTPEYFGRNGLRLHSEYLGPAMLLLALLGLGRGGSDRRTARFGFGTIGIFFLLIALGGATPVFRIWYEIVPLSDRLRAPGQCFFLVAMALAFFAGLGAERLYQGRASLRRLMIGAAVIAVLALLAAIGGLQGLTESIAARSGLFQEAIANAEPLRMDGIRLLLVAGVGAGVLFAGIRGHIGRSSLVSGTMLFVAADAWLVGRKYFVFSPGASVSYADDPITERIRQTPLPYRVWVPTGRDYGHLGPYPRSWLMSREIPQLFGYHGNELRYFDELLGGKELWEHQVNPNIWGLFAIRYVVLSSQQTIPGFRQVLGPVGTTPGAQAYLYEADSAPPYVRVMAGAAKAPEGEIVAALTNPQFPWDRVVLYSDTASITPEPLGTGSPQPSPVQARVRAWRPGRMEIDLAGTAATTQYLLVAENWYQDWHAFVDGNAASVLRGQYTLLSVPVQPGTREVVLEYRSEAYRRGRLISLVSSFGILGLFAAAVVQRRRRNA
ncbi:MAG: hypothetical protein ACT4PM_11730 [Gemmatimonadales bacterium]